MNARLSFFIGMVVLALFASPAAGQQTPEELLQSALYKQQVEGDLEGAVVILQTLIDDYAEHREIAASALVLLGRVHETLGSANAARAYRRVVNDYPDQRGAVAEARARLAALTRPPPMTIPSMIQVRQLMGGSDDAADLFGGPYPDGRHFVHTDWNTGGLAVRDLATGESRQITQGDREDGDRIGAKVSPDGKLIAYLWFPADPSIDRRSDDPSGLRVVGTDGSGDRFLRRASSSSYFSTATSGSWSRDSRHIAAIMHNGENLDTEIVWISVEDGSMTSLKTFRDPDKVGPNTSHSPDDRFLAVELPVVEDSGRVDIVLVSTEGGGTLPLVDHPADDRLMGWVPGTDAVLFQSDRSGSWDLWAVRVSREGIPGRPFSVRRGGGEIGPLGFTADGSLFFSIYRGGYGKSVIPFDEDTGTILLDAAEPILGSHDNSGFGWSPTGDSLVLAYREGGGTETIRLRDMSTGTERVLTRDINPAATAGPRWMPDGRSILTVGMDVEIRPDDWSKNPAGLFRIDVETGETTRLFDFPPDEYWWMRIALVPTADGKGIIYHHKGTGRLVRLDLDSGREEELYRHPDLTGPLRWSPDGSELLFGIADTPVTNWFPSGTRLMIMPSRGGEPHELLRVELPGEVGSFNWTSDGRHILFVQRHEGVTAVMRIPREGGDPERLWETDEPLGSLSLSPDHRKVGMMTHPREIEIWVMENLVEALRESEARR